MLHRHKIPKIWRQSKIIAILKPGKDSAIPKNYRPISLLCHTYKLYERLILNRVSPLLEQHLIKEQAGFRPGKSCTSQLLNLTQHIEDGYQRGMITGADFVDLSAEYDTVNHRILIQKLYNTTQDSQLCRVFQNMLSHRRFYVELNNERSRWRKKKNGLPQGSVLSPILFNIYTNNQPIHDGTRNFIYADDICVSTLYVSVLFIHRSRNYHWRCTGRTHTVAPNGYSLLVVGVPQSGEHCANCIHLPRLSGGPASQFFGEASRAFPQHGWRSAYSLRETLSPTQDQGQHPRPLHTHTPTDSLIQPPRPCPPPLHSPPTTQNTHSHLLSTSPHTHSLHPRPNTTCPSRLSPHFPTTQTSTRPHTCTLPHTQKKTTKHKEIKILQLNANGIRSTVEELKHLLLISQPDVVTVQESKLNKTSRTPKIPNYTAIRTDRQHKQGGGLLLLSTHSHDPC